MRSYHPTTCLIHFHSNPIPSVKEDPKFGVESLLRTRSCAAVVALAILNYLIAEKER